MRRNLDELGRIIESGLRELGFLRAERSARLRIAFREAKASVWMFAFIVLSIAILGWAFQSPYDTQSPVATVSRYLVSSIMAGLLIFYQMIPKKRRTWQYTTTSTAQVFEITCELSQKGGMASLIIRSQVAPDNARSAERLIKEVSKMIESEELAINVFEPSPVIPVRRRAQPSDAEASTSIRRPLPFKLLPGLIAGFSTLGIILLLGVAASVSSANADVSDTFWQTNSHLAAMAAALIGSAALASNAMKWERIAWIKLSRTSDPNRYFKATKELREYAATMISGTIAVLALLLIIAVVAAVAQVRAGASPAFQGFGPVLVAILSLLTFTSAGKVLGSARSSLNETFVGGWQRH